MQNIRIEGQLSCLSWESQWQIRATSRAFLTLEPVLLEKRLGKTDTQVYWMGLRKISSFSCPSELESLPSCWAERERWLDPNWLSWMFSLVALSIFPKRCNLWTLLSPREAGQYVGCRWNFYWVGKASFCPLWVIYYLPPLLLWLPLLPGVGLSWEWGIVYGGWDWAGVQRQ